MAEIENAANVTALRPSPGEGPTANALRQRRYRKRRKSVTRNAPVTPAPAVTVAHPTVTRDGDRGVTVSTTVAALGLATVSAGFSITGMTSVFTGAFWPVIGMGAALELGKLSAVAWLGRGAGPRALRAALGVLVAVLMGLNAMGAYGFLAKAHIGHAIAGEMAVAGRAAEIDARITLQAGLVADIDRRIAQIDSAVDKTTAKGRGAAAMALADQQRKPRAELVAQRTAEARTLAGLQVEKAGIEGQRKVAEADLGPVRYLATLLGADSETALRWFVLVVALLLDPAAVLLLLAASSARR
jgi:hypothetical protein